MNINKFKAGTYVTRKHYIDTGIKPYPVLRIKSMKPWNSNIKPENCNAWSVHLEVINPVETILPDDGCFWLKDDGNILEHYHTGCKYIPIDKESIIRDRMFTKDQSSLYIEFLKLKLKEFGYDVDYELWGKTNMPSDTIQPSNQTSSAWHIIKLDAELAAKYGQEYISVLAKDLPIGASCRTYDGIDCIIKGQNTRVFNSAELYTVCTPINGGKLVAIKNGTYVLVKNVI